MQRPARGISMMTLLLSTACVHLFAATQRPYPTATLAVSGSLQPGDNGGNIQVDFNGFVEVIHYGPSSTAASIASGLGAMFTRDFRGFGLYAKAGANGNSDPKVVTFQLTNGSSFGPPNIAGPSASFNFIASGFGGSSAGTPDIGSVALQFNGTTIATARYGEGSTPASIAAELAQTANSGLVTITAEGPNLSLQTKQTGTFSSPYSLVFTSTQSGFSQPSFSGSPASGTLTGSSGTAAIPVYSYSIANGSSSGYSANGNVVNVTDSVMGTWSYGYDSLNRLTSGTSTAGPYAGQSACWSYDSFGNRTSQSVSTTACGNSPPATFATTYNTNNRIASVSAPAAMSISYDAAGNVLSDGNNTYLYDAEGRLCAMHGPEGMVGYLYNADGNRVGKGMIANMNSCDPTQNGFVPTNDYVLDQSGAQMTEVAWQNGTAVMQHTNVMANGTLFASLDSEGWHFHLNDPLGSRRLQTDAAGLPEQSCQSLPFGDQLFCTGSANFPTEHHFTGKERDTESGLDYFGARYYASNMGRWMSPDWADKPEAVPYSDLSNPQSLNLYGYVNNNPLSKTDPDGHCCWDYITGAVAGVLNTVPDTFNAINSAGNAALSTFTSYRIPMYDRIGADNPAMQTGMNAGTALSIVAPIGDMAEGAQILRNAAQGKAFQEAVAADTAATVGPTVQNITLQTESGARTVMDVAARDGSGSAVLREAKSSATAPLTKGQAAAHPEIAKTGATVMGQGKPGFPGGTKIPPTQVEVVRPKPNTP